jgi:hypothetical protein
MIQRVVFKKLSPTPTSEVFSGIRKFLGRLICRMVRPIGAVSYVLVDHQDVASL